MSTDLDPVGALAVTRHAGQCNGCHRNTFRDKLPVYQLTNTEPPVRYVTLCEPCIRQVITAIEEARG
jgi:hypothetical protein